MRIGHVKSYCSERGALVNINLGSAGQGAGLAYKKAFVWSNIK
jgi:hypothetical protein